MKIFAIIPAAGVGQRMQNQLPKQYIKIKNKTVLEYSLQTFLQAPAVAKIAVVVSAQDPIWKTLAISQQTKIKTVMGGEQRSHSVLNGLLALQEIAQADDWVLVHDAVRPCLQHSDLENLMQTLQNDAVGGLLAVPVRDTLKKVEAGKIISTMSRENLWQALTPQLFRYSLLLAALQTALKNNILPTDEAQAIEMAGLVPSVVLGRSDNIKITYPEDLVLAEKILLQDRS